VGTKVYLLLATALLSGKTEDPACVAQLSVILLCQ
jgi:hypothetical protein